MTLGFDLDAWRPTPEQTADYQESLDQGYGYGPDLRVDLAQLVSPPRSVVLAAVLMAVEDENLTESPAEVPAVLSARGLWMPTSDEWEQACGAGADTLFRWGDTCPWTASRTGTEPARALSERLRPAHRLRHLPLGADERRHRGPRWGRRRVGVRWKRHAAGLATSNRNPFMAEFVYGPDGEDMYEDSSTRPVLTL
ncbi:hypothetical protein [Streptomyces sp. WMMC940]|uniref:hypothetical protein n=1 Tax=Streptomyces sp. WMMC940 TaxID=3015153 RepID=UPI0022B65A63|nr:hypothetical protein [Streptomyces sp. WMMC940]MCZ7459323.1 hypothetical protein [Streptomyces sp. WMMC940]